MWDLRCLFHGPAISRMHLFLVQLRWPSFVKLNEIILKSMATRQAQKGTVIGPLGCKRKYRDSWKSTL